MIETEIVICNWRVTRGVPSGLHVWFDPGCEMPKLHRIPLDEQRRDPADDAGVDKEEGSGYLDKVGSVSESEQGKARGDTDRYEQFRFTNSEDELPF